MPVLCLKTFFFGHALGPAPLYTPSMPLLNQLVQVILLFIAPQTLSKEAAAAA